MPSAAFTTASTRADQAHRVTSTPGGLAADAVPVAVYALSPGEGRPAMRLADCRAAAEQRGWTVQREFWDCAPSAEDARLSTGEQWNLLLRIAETGLVRGIVVYDTEDVVLDASCFRALENWAADQMVSVLFLHHAQEGAVGHLIGPRPRPALVVA
ncbi:hypothetical protein ACFVHB_38415 [Kitasatospora sp. NPDC127111]|uniref:hypothetical protein n=1 Tax=Kitasatospora sp. NPDC127111 TaxID=3345363 RepID=UPI0036331772